MRRILCFIIAIFGIANVCGQNSLTREMTIEKEYNPSIRDANKINELPELKTPEVVKTTVEYSDYAIPYTLSPYLINYEASSYFTDLGTSNKRGYINLGVSTLLDIDGDFGYQLINNNSDFLNIYASNRYSDSKVQYVQDEKKSPMKIHDILGGLNYNHNFDKAKLSLGGQYTFSSFNYYGCPNASLINRSTVKNFIQKNHIVLLHAGVESINNEEVDYSLNFGYTNFGQKHSYWIPGEDSRREQRFMMQGDLKARLNADAELGLQVYLRHYTYSDDKIEGIKYSVSKAPYTTFVPTPYIKYEVDNFDAIIGANIGIQFGKRKEFLLSPNIKFNYRAHNNFLIYLEAVGGIKDNSNYEIHYENRYLAPELRVLDSRTPLDATFGVKLGLVPGLSFDLFTGYKNTKDEHFYYASMPATNPYREQSHTYNTIQVDYADANTFKLGASLNYKWKDQFSFSTTATYYNWDVSKDLDKKKYSYEELESPLLKGGAWNKPDFVLDAMIGYQFAEVPGYQIYLNYHSEYGRQTIAQGLKKNMKNIHELNVKGIYALSDMLSINVSLNNLLFQKYDIWYAHPAQGFNLMGGLSVKF